MDRLRVSDFRNLHEIVINPAPGVNVICGQNGQGKTNLLEAMWLFTGEKSFRGAKEGELISFGGEWASAEMNFYGGGRENSAILRLGPKRRTLLNGVTLSSVQDLSGYFCAVVFAPIHLSLVKGAPAERRRALDSIICQIKPRYLTLLAQYGRILTQRTALLREIAMMRGNADSLEIWDRALAKAGALLIKTRESYVRRLCPLAQGVYDGLSQGKEELSLCYHATAPDEAEGFYEALHETRTNDIRLGNTSVGPHRDDLDIQINHVSAKAFASQGQQRSAVLAFKMAECGIIEQVSGERPVVLLDDVLSELDEMRREYLLHQLTERQIFLTCCDPRQTEGIGREAVFLVSEGTILIKRGN